MCVVRVYFIKLWLSVWAMGKLLVAPQQGSGDENERELPSEDELCEVWTVGSTSATLRRRKQVRHDAWVLEWLRIEARSSSPWATASGRLCFGKWLALWFHDKLLNPSITWRYRCVARVWLYCCYVSWRCRAEGNSSPRLNPWVTASGRVYCFNASLNTWLCLFVLIEF